MTATNDNDLKETLPTIEWPAFWVEMSPDIQKHYEYLLTTSRPVKGYKRGRRGFVPDEEASLWRPDVPRLVYYIEMLLECRVNHIRSLREAVDMVKRYEKTNDSWLPDGVTTLSVAGLSKIFTSLEKELGVASVVANTGKIREHIELTPRQRAIQGDHRNLKSKPRQATRLTKRRKVVHDEIVELNKQIKSSKLAQKQLQSRVVKRAAKLGIPGDPTKITVKRDVSGFKEVTESLSRESQVVEKKDSDLGKKASILIKPTADLITRYSNGLASSQKESELMDMYQEIMATKGKQDARKIAFLPTPRQYLFMSADEDIVLYGGQAGGGKSYSMVLDALRYVSIPHYKGVIIRKTTKELGELIDNSRELYPIAYKGAKYNASAGRWTFPSGAQIFFGYLDAASDKYQYQGHQYQYVGFDELSTQPTDEGFRYLHSRARDPKELIKPAMRATANPGSLWVYEMFIKDREPMKRFLMPGTENNPHPITMKFIPAQLSDNPHLDNNGLYRSVLMAQDELTREQLLEGNWLIADDNMFPEFKPAVHVVEPYDVPRHWNRTAGLDYGYRDPSAGVWFATNPENGNIVVYDEFLQRGLTGREFGLAVQEKEQYDPMLVDHPIDWSIFARTGHTGPTIAESMQSVPNLRLRPADRNREAGWVRVHDMFRDNMEIGGPQIEIFSSCTQLIRQLQTAKIHKTKPNDLDSTRNKEGHWDLLDAFRYGIMSRPRRQTFEDRLLQHKQHDGWGKVQSYFSF